MMKETVVRMTQWLCTALMAGAACTAAASDYPSKPVKLIVGYPAGGGADIVGRAVAQKLAGRLGQPIVVENRGGAAGVIATAAAASAPADGYTLLLGHVNAMAIAQSSVTPPSYDAAKDFAPVAYIGFVPNILVVHPSNPARSVADLVAQARKARASSASPRPAWVAPTTWPGRCSSPPPASISSMCLTVAARRPSPTCWAARSR